MPRPGWSAKRKRQYEHIRDGLLGRGMSQGKTEEIAARTVNKERVRTGEAKANTPLSTDPASGSRGS